MNKTFFQLKNAFGKDICIIHELEGFEFILPPNEEVTIETSSSNGESIILRIGSINDEYEIGLLSGLSYYKVYYKGEDVFKKYFE